MVQLVPRNKVDQLRNTEKEIMKKILVLVGVLFCIQLVRAENWLVNTPRVSPEWMPFTYEQLSKKAVLENRRLIIYVNNPNEDMFLADKNDLKHHALGVAWGPEVIIDKCVVIGEVVNGELACTKLLKAAPVQWITQEQNVQANWIVQAPASPTLGTTFVRTFGAIPTGNASPVKESLGTCPNGQCPNATTYKRRQ